MTAPTYTTREAWLQALVAELRPWYDGVLPETIHVSVGFSSKGARSKVVGQCWAASCSADGWPQIFIHPGESDAVEVADTMTHELIHACGVHGHGADFRKIAVGLGLTGKMKSSVAGPELKAELQRICASIGEYPHPKLTTGAPSSAGPKQGTRMLKVECPSGDGYTVRMTRKWLEEMGSPGCPCGEQMVEAI